MSKIDELREAYSAAYQTKLNSYDYDDAAADCIAEAERAGIIAVVTKLRDGMASGTAWHAINEILGSSENEKAAGLNPVVAMPAEQNREVQPPAAPTTAPAPTVGQRLIKAAHEAAAIARGEGGDAAPEMCEWTRDFEPFAWTECSGEQRIEKGVVDCPSCGLPITFKETT